MSCLLTTGFPVDCMDANGGVKALYFANFENVASITTSTANVVTAMTMESSTYFYEYRMVPEVGSAAFSPQPNIQNGTNFYEQVVTLVMIKMATDKRNEVMLLGKANTMIIVLDNEDTYWLVGETRGAWMTAGDIGTGTAYGDRNGYSLTFTAKERALPKAVSAAVIATITP